MNSSLPLMSVLVESRGNQSVRRLHGQLMDRHSLPVLPTTKFVSGPSPLKRQLARVRLYVVAAIYFYVVFVAAKHKKSHLLRSFHTTDGQGRLLFGSFGPMLSVNGPPACFAAVHHSPIGPILRSRSSSHHNED